MILRAIRSTLLRCSPSLEPDEACNQDYPDSHSVYGDEEKMLQTKRKKIRGLTRKLQEMAESVSDGKDSDLLAAILPDSDCSESNLHLLSSVLRHIVETGMGPGTMAGPSEARPFGS